MGGDQDPAYVAELAAFVHARGYKTAWYSGRDFGITGLRDYDFIKTGPYIEALGGLKSPTTNQRFYRRDGEKWIDETHLFRPLR